MDSTYALVYHATILLGSSVLSNRPLGAYHLETYGMPLHDVVGVNYQRGATTVNQGAGVLYMD